MSNVKTVHNHDKVMIELGGKERELRFDLNAFAELEAKFGSVEKAMQQMQSGGMKAIKTIVWVGLIHEEAVVDEDGNVVKYNITPYTVGSWITPDKLTEVSEKLTMAMNGSMPTPENMTVMKKPVVMIEGVATVVPTEEERAEEAKNA